MCVKPMWNNLMKQLDLEEPAPHSGQAYSGCTQRECKPRLKIVHANNDLLESLIPAGNIRQSHGWEKSHADTVAGSYDIEGHAKRCVERYCELANKKFEFFLIEEELETVRELSKVCSELVVKRLYFALIGRPEILRSVNYLARDFTTWNKACEKRLARLISFIDLTTGYRQHCYVGNTAS